MSTILAAGDFHWLPYLDHFSCTYKRVFLPKLISLCLRKHFMGYFFGRKPGSPSFDLRALHGQDWC